MLKETQFTPRPTYSGSPVSLSDITDEVLMDYIRNFFQFLPPTIECTTANLAMFLKFEYGIFDEYAFGNNKGLRNRLTNLSSKENSTLHCDYVTDKFPKRFVWSVK